MRSGTQQLHCQGVSVSSKVQTKTESWLTCRWQPYGASKCKICKQNVPQTELMYCQGCAYQKGMCAMCGKQILDTSSYKQSAK